MLWITFTLQYSQGIACRRRATVQSVIKDHPHTAEILAKMEIPDRFLIGSDPVWPVDNRHPWHEADTGWDRIPDFLAFHRRWIATLPEPVRNKLLRDNAFAFLRLDPAAL